jgi:hypothetical protein
VGTIGLILPFAVGVALSPMAIVAVIVLTQSSHAAVNAGAFVAGWLLGLVIVTMALLLATGLLGAGGAATPGWVAIARIVGGLVLLLFAWERASAARIASTASTWIGGLDRVSADRALAMGALQAALDPRKLIILAAVALTVGRVGQGSTEALVAVIVFVIIGTLGVALPLILPRIAGAAAHPRLEMLRDRLADDNATIQAVTLLLLGALLVGQGLAGL